MALGGEISELSATSEIDYGDQWEHTAALSNQPKYGRPKRKSRHYTGRQPVHLTKKHRIQHPDAELALKLNVERYVEAEKKRLDNNKYAVNMKVASAETQRQHEQMMDLLLEIE